MIPDHGQREPEATQPQPSTSISHMTNGVGTAGQANRTLKDVCVELHGKVQAFLQEEPKTQLLAQVQQQVRVSIGVVEDALKRYEPSQLALSYNGGKDCLVLLIIVLSCLASRSSSASTSTTDESFPETLNAVYVVAPHSFPQVDEFTESSAKDYHLDLCRFAQSLRAALAAYLDARPAVRAIFVGTRRTDPHGEKLTHFDPTDKGWPDFMRIHPVIDWHYAEIWTFIRHLEIPYCSLYDQGYTSLGGVLDTRPNPHLKKDGNGDGQFRPAYELTADDEERLGRDA